MVRDFFLMCPHVPHVVKKEDMNHIRNIRSHKDGNESLLINSYRLFLLMWSYVSYVVEGIGI